MQSDLQQCIAYQYVHVKSIHPGLLTKPSQLSLQRIAILFKSEQRCKQTGTALLSRD